MEWVKEIKQTTQIEREEEKLIEKSKKGGDQCYCCNNCSVLPKPGDFIL